MEAEPRETETKPEHKYPALRRAVRLLYDLQTLHIQSGNRTESTTSFLAADELEFFNNTKSALKSVEKDALKQVAKQLKGIPIYERWLKQQKGLGPTLCGLIISEIPIDNDFTTVSKLWRFCGFGVDPRDGRAERRRKGEKLHYNPWLKAKLGHVMGECLLRSTSPWRKFYDNYKHRKQHQQVPVCMGCEGTGKFKSTPKADAEEASKSKGSLFKLRRNGWSCPVGSQ